MSTNKGKIESFDDAKAMHKAILKVSKYRIIFSKEYQKRVKKINCDQTLQKIETVIDKLASGEKLEARYKDHKLKGDYKDFREWHIKPDLLLIYQIYEDILILNAFRLGSHSELFN